MHQEIRELQDDDEDGQVGKTRRLTNMVSRVKRKLKTTEEEVTSVADENSRNFQEINDKIDQSITNAHNQLIQATNNMVRSG